MGLLDDAIRDHLDLKRRHGADPAELERAEREALGPVRREPEAVPSEPPPYEAYDVYQDQPATELEQPEAAPQGGWEEEPGEAGYEPEPPRRRSRLSRIFGRSDDEAEDELEYDEGELEPEEPGSFHEDEPAHGAAAVEERAVDPLEARDDALHQAEEGDEDVLEETPEFLQDTPDHDRLWFEQRPPRDFDFDG